MTTRYVDNLIAFRLLYMLVTPFTETDAYKLGIIDAEGKNLRPSRTLKTNEEKNAYNYLTRFIFNVKKIIAKLPGGDTKLNNIVVAMFLVKEYYERGRSTSLTEGYYTRVLDKVNRGLVLVEEEIMVRRFLEYMVEEGEGGAPANNTVGASVNEPKITKKNIKQYQLMQRRKKPVNVPS